jgi:DNA modification methylase
MVVWQLNDLFITKSQFIEPTMVYSVNMFAEFKFKVLWIRIWEKQGINFGGTLPYYLASTKPAQQYEQVVAVASEERFKDFEGANMAEYNWVTAFAGHQYKFVKRLSVADRKEWGYAGIWKINTVHANDKHPAMFPLELPRRCILMHSDQGRIVLEPFCGAGTTIMACENTNRIGRGIELMPKYLAVSLQRWADATGGQPERIAE